MNNRTPRTDEHLRWRRDNGLVAIITQDFARQLERELAAAKAELRKLRKKINEKKENNEKF